MFVVFVVLYKYLFFMNIFDRFLWVELLTEDAFTLYCFISLSSVTLNLYLVFQLWFPDLAFLYVDDLDCAKGCICCYTAVSKPKSSFFK